MQAQKNKRNTMKTIYLTALLTLLSLSILAQQNVEFDRGNFDDKKGYRQAKKDIKEGDDFYERGAHFMRIALPFYEKANDFNPDNAELNYKIGRCLLRTARKFEAFDYFVKAKKLDPNVSEDIHYYIGRGYHLNYKFDEAIQEYNTYKNTLNPKKQERELADTHKKIQECNYGKQHVANPIRVWIDNLGKNINSKFPEYGIVLNGDETEMMFTSRRPSTTGGQMDPVLNEYHEDIYYSVKTGKSWSPARTLSEKINTDGHDAIIALSPDGQKLLVYRDDKGVGNIYESVKKKGEWSKPKKLGKNINTKNHEPTAWYSPDGKILYFVSSREDDGSHGGKDIFKSYWDEKKERWGEAINLGPTINTPYDEDGVFMHPDGKTLYFSSQGHSSMGGYDIFKSELQDDDTWSKPENIGYPINTTDDDVFFVVSASGRHAYYSSFQEDGYGEKDLYKITFLGNEKEPILNAEDKLLAGLDQAVRGVVIEPKVEVKSSRMAMLKGKVRDAKSKEPVEAILEVIDNEKNEIITTHSTDDVEGKFLFSLPAGKNYGIAVKAEGYLFHSENFILPDSTGFRMYEKIIDLKKVEVGEKIVLRNIFFDYDKYTLRDESEAELERLTKLMEDNGTLRIEISGHTDSRGSAQYNQQLSQNRAKTVVEYLIEKGIDKSRLEFKGYGEEQPIASNDTSEGRQENRRTEFKILGK